MEQIKSIVKNLPFLPDCKLSHLRKIAKELGIKNRNTFSKAALIEEISDLTEDISNQAYSNPPTIQDLNKTTESETTMKTTAENPTIETTATILSMEERAAVLKEETLKHPLIKDKSDEGVASRVARYLNKEGYKPSEGKFFNARRVLDLFNVAQPEAVEETAAEAEPTAVAL